MPGSSAGQKNAPIWTSTCAAQTTATSPAGDRENDTDVVAITNGAFGTGGFCYSLAVTSLGVRPDRLQQISSKSTPPLPCEWVAQKRIHDDGCANCTWQNPERPLRKLTPQGQVPS